VTTLGTNSRRSRPTVHIDSKLEKRLLGYITAAGAASIGLMAITQPAEAKVVYTPLNNVPLTSLTTVDLNGDGVADITFKFYTTYHGAFQEVYPAAAGNGIAFGTVNHSSGPLPLPWLTRVGWKTKFSTQAGREIITGVDGCHSYCFDVGIWQHQTNKYLGIKFLINGKTHFGWMRMTVGAALTGYATGYAYETMADQPILAGKTSGPDVETRAALPAPTLPVKPLQSLGMLALGVDGVAIWRREEEAFGL
jgi:hypothetical protein